MSDFVETARLVAMFIPEQKLANNVPGGTYEEKVTSIAQVLGGEVPVSTIADARGIADDVMAAIRASDNPFALFAISFVAAVRKKPQA